MLKRWITTFDPITPTLLPLPPRPPVFSIFWRAGFGTAITCPGYRNPPNRSRGLVQAGRFLDPAAQVLGPVQNSVTLDQVLRGEPKKPDSSMSQTPFGLVIQNGRGGHRRTVLPPGNFPSRQTKITGWVCPSVLTSSCQTGTAHPFCSENQPVWRRTLPHSSVHRGAKHLQSASGILAE